MSEAWGWLAIGAGLVLLLIGILMWLFDSFVNPWLEKHDRGHD